MSGNVISGLELRDVPAVDIRLALLFLMQHIENEREECLSSSIIRRQYEEILEVVGNVLSGSNDG
jgi:hypothetical protein